MIYVWGTFSFQCFRKILKMLPTPVPTQHPLLTAPLHWRFLMHAQMCQRETTGQKGVQNFQIYVKTVGCNNIQGTSWPRKAGFGQRNISLTLPWKAHGSHVKTIRLPCPLDPTLRTVSFVAFSFWVLRSASVSVCRVSSHVGWWLHSGCLVILCPLLSPRSGLDKYWYFGV